MERLLKPYTTYLYFLDLVQFGDVVGYENPVSKDSILKYRIFLFDKKYKNKTKVRKMSVVNEFLIFYEKETYELSQYQDLLKIKLEKNAPLIIEEEDIITLLKNFKATSYNNVLNFVIVYVLVKTGLRVSELVNLKIDDINLDDCYFKIFGKRDKTRLVYFDENTLNCILILFRLRKLFNVKQSDYFFIKSTGSQVTKFYVYNLIKKTSSKVLYKELTPHQLRHFYASYTLKNGGSLLFVKRQLGHESIVTTKLYTEIDMEECKKIYDSIFKNK